MQTDVAPILLGVIVLIAGVPEMISKAEQLACSIQKWKKRHFWYGKLLDQHRFGVAVIFRERDAIYFDLYLGTHYLMVTVLYLN
jgi:hypothetical protein